MDKRIIEETPSTEVLNDDWFIKDSPTGGTSKILGSNLKDIISGDVEDAIDKILSSIALKWSPTTTYGFDAYVIYEGELWRCFKDTGSTRGEFKTSEWIKAVTSGYITHVVNKIADRFVASNPPFMTYRYRVGDMVFYSEPYHDEQLYVCNTDLPQGESTFNPEHWDVVYTVAGLSKYLMDKIAEAGQIDDVQVKTTGDYESVVDENKVAKIDLSNMLIEKSVPNLPQSVATFNDGSDLPLKSLTASIVPVQSGSGDPSPTNVRPISGWTGCKVVDDAVYGGFINWNQLVQNGDFNVASSSGWGVNGGSIRISNNTATITISNEGTEGLLYRQDLVCPATHKFIFICDFKFNGVQAHTNISGYTSEWQTSIGTVPTKSYGNIEYAFFTPSSNNLNILYIYKQNVQSGDILAYKNIMIIDLTQMFGSTKADEIYAMEQAEAGSGVAYFKSLFYKDYYPYNSGEITNVSAVNGDTDKYTTTTIPFTDGQGQSHTCMGGYFEVINGPLTEDVKFYDDLSDVTFELSANGNYYWSRSTTIPYALNLTDGMCSHFKFGSSNDVWCGINDSTGRYILFVKANIDSALGISSVEEFNTWLDNQSTNGTPVQLWYKLATPNAPIQQQPTSIKSLDGDNNVFASTGDVTKLDYIANATDVIANLEARVTALES